MSLRCNIPSVAWAPVAVPRARLAPPRRSVSRVNYANDKPESANPLEQLRCTQDPRERARCVIVGGRVPCAGAQRQNTQHASLQQADSCRWQTSKWGLFCTSPLSSPLRSRLLSTPPLPNLPPIPSPWQNPCVRAKLPPHPHPLQATPVLGCKVGGAPGFLCAKPSGAPYQH